MEGGPYKGVQGRRWGIGDHEFRLLDGREKMITKMPIRLISLQALDLPNHDMLIDIGFCTGSVSIEAKLQFPHLCILSLEKREECRDIMETNCRRLGVPGIISKICDALSFDFSEVDTIFQKATRRERPRKAFFIGGHGGRLEELMVKIRSAMKEGDVVVMNSVSEASREAFERAAMENGLTLSRRVHIALDEYNPINIMKCTLEGAIPAWGGDVAIVRVGTGDVAQRLKGAFPDADIISIGEARCHLASSAYSSYIFVSAMGICVRTIAPYALDKHTDPAVVCVDTMGRNAVAVLSGHVGGANELARMVAHALGAHVVITTHSDLRGTWALDTLAERFGWAMANGGHDEPPSINRQIALFTGGAPTALLLEARDSGTEWMETHMPGNVSIVKDLREIDEETFQLLIIVSPFLYDGIKIPSIHYVPRSICIGVGLARQAGPTEQVGREILARLQERGINPLSIGHIATIEEKGDEPALGWLAEHLGADITLYKGEELEKVDVPHPSDIVGRHMGTKSVSEAAAILRAGSGLVVGKEKGANWTVAAAMMAGNLREGFVDFVGAGPGDPELISLRGRLLVEHADLILYAGSLVPRQLTLAAKDGAMVRSSASMTLEEQVALMLDFCQRGKRVVRLHTGDPCLYGAIQEQMNILDEHGIGYRITPGISAFQAAAAELRSQFTIPEKTQTIILTRGEGRTKMPPGEQLRLLARSRSTMCIYLSADIVEKVEAELLREYPAETPVAVCHKLTWPEQKIIRGRLGELAHIVRSNGLRLDTLIVVGEAIDNRAGLSRLYSRHFTHLFRQSSDEEAQGE